MTHNNITFCLKIPYFTINTVLHTHPLKFSNLAIVHTLDFWYMIKNKETIGSAAREFSSRFLQIADSPAFLA